MMNKLITILGLMFVAVWIVPLLRRLNLVSVFNYLEMRFHPTIRMIGSALCMAMHVGGRMSVVLFLPALAIATITGIDVVWSILIMGVCTIVYTAMGGMRAVVWTDFVQVIVLMGGALFAIFFIFNALGSDAIFATARAFNKTKLVNLSFDLTQPTVWGFVFLILFDVVLTFPKDQVLMQRTLATDSPKAAGRSIWMFAAIMLPGGLIFYGIGTVLFAYLQGASRAARSAAADRRDLPAVHLGGAAGGPDRTDHRGYFRRRDGHAVRARSTASRRSCRWISTRSSRAIRREHKHQALRRVDDAWSSAWSASVWRCCCRASTFIRCWI